VDDNADDDDADGDDADNEDANDDDADDDEGGDDDGDDDDDEDDEDGVQDNVDIEDLTLLQKIRIVVEKVRKLIKTIRKSSNIFDYLQPYRKLHKIKHFLVIDFHIRWNTTYIMLLRFEKYRGIIEMLTSNPEKVTGLKNSLINKIKRLKLNESEWKVIKSLTEVLMPVYFASKLLQGKIKSI
jgi:hypothetical protein